MALVDVGGFVFLGSRYAMEVMSGSVRSQPRLNSNPTKAWFSWQATKTGSVESIALNISAITTSQSIDLRIETLDTNGHASGTAITNGTKTFTPATGWNTIAFDTAPSVTANQWYAILIEWTSTQGDVTFRSLTSPQGHPYLWGWTGSAWAAQDGNAGPLRKIKYTDGSYPYDPNGFPEYDFNTNNLSSASGRREGGLRFKLPYAARIAGIWGAFDHNQATDMPAINFYTDAQAPGAGTELLQIGDQGAGENNLAGNTALNSAFFVFPTPQEIAANTWYKITHEPSTASGVTDWDVLFATSANEKEALGLPLDWEHTYTDNDTTWTNAPTRIPVFGLMLDQIDNGAGGGGESAHVFAG